MLPSVGFAEMVVLMLLAIIVVGPKDLPKLMRTLGQWMGKIRAMGQEFKDAFNDMDAEGEIAEMRREIQELKKLSPLSEDFDEDLANEMRGLDSDIREATDMSSPRKPDTSS
ncbi:Sec-independent protein translocase protein TatB [Litorimonas sp. RW-G-Af-16]|uniref:Sec-independent protein translocase protein TatB n=1 Tax=Litorimonas sp. RW-G-Af-16 TaxID=3241168 RepID=UPI00390C6833